MRSRLQNAGLAVNLNHLLVLPHLKVQTQTVQWPRERIVDSEDIARIVSRVTDLLGAGLPHAQTHDRMLAFFQNRFRVEMDASALTGHLQQQATRMSAGLATWVPRVHPDSGLIRVIGTAGSGKTQLALRLVSVRTSVSTFHEFASHMVRRSGQAVDFSLPNAFDTLTARCIALLEHTAPDLDLLVLDETQFSDPLIYHAPGDIAPCTIQAVERCLQRGFALSEIAIVSMRGRERSVLQSLDKLGAWTLHHFTGQFDEASTPIWKNGQLLIESVRGFTWNG